MKTLFVLFFSLFAVPAFAAQCVYYNGQTICGQPMQTIVPQAPQPMLSCNGHIEEHVMDRFGTRQAFCIPNQPRQPSFEQAVVGTVVQGLVNRELIKATGQALGNLRPNCYGCGYYGGYYNPAYYGHYNY